MEPGQPLHQPSSDPQEIWGSRLDIKCDCEKTHPLWSKKCPGCRRKNPLWRLVKKTKRLDSWFDKQIEATIIPAIEKAILAKDAARKFDNNLAGVVRRPFPERRKNEDPNKHLKRVVSFFPTFFKTTSPKQMAIRLSDSIPRSANTIARTAYNESLALLEKSTGSPFPRPDARQVSGQAMRVNEDLLELSTPYLEALRTLQLSHSRMVTAYGPAREIFRRPVEDGGKAKALWNKARSMMSSSGEHIRFPTAIWKDAEELEKIKRLDTNLAKFLEQAGHFRKQLPRLVDRTAVLTKSYRLSVRRYLARTLLDRAARGTRQERENLTRRLLSQKGVGSWMWRLLFGVRP